VELGISTKKLGQSALEAGGGCKHWKKKLGSTSYMHSIKKMLKTMQPIFDLAGGNYE
jgi:hypothetical protein